MILPTTLILVKSFMLTLVFLTPLLLFFLRADLAICFVVASFFFFPSSHLITNYKGLPYFSFLQISHSIGLFAVMIRDRVPALAFSRRAFAALMPPNRADYFILVLFIAAVLFQLVAGLTVNQTLAVVPKMTYVINYIDVFSSIVFMWACMILLHNRVQYENVFKTIILCALCLSVELILTYSVPYLTATLGHWSIIHGSRFRSLFLNDFFAVPLWSSFAFILVSYFVVTRPKRFVWAIVGAIVLLPIIVNFKRSILLGLALVFSVWIYSQLRSKRLKTIYLICLLITGALSLSLVRFKHERPANMHLSVPALSADSSGLSPDSSVLSPGSSALPADSSVLLQRKSIKPDKLVKGSVSYLDRRLSRIRSVNSALVRVGQLIRGTQVFLETSLFGVGPNFMRYYMLLPQYPVLEQDSLWLFKKYPYIWERGYKRATPGGEMIDVQVGYFSFMYSFGFLGLVLEIFIIGMIIFCSYQSFKHLERQSANFALFLASYSALAFFGFVFFFITTPILYVITFVLLHAVLTTKNLKER